MASVRIELTQGVWTEISDSPSLIRHNIGNTQIVYVSAESLPASFDRDSATMLTSVKGSTVASREIGVDDKLYAYAISGDAEISVSEISSSSARFLEGMVTDAREGNARFRVDSQPTSFEENKQFKIFYRIEDVAHTNQMVIKFESINALVIMVRKINLWEGGREYLVYGDDGSHTVTGTFSPLSVFNVNSNSEGNALPVSQVTASIAIGGGIFVAGSEASNGDGVLTDSNANRANNQPLSDSNQSGTSPGDGFFLVFNHIGQNSVTNGQFFLQWEELF